MHRVVFGIFFVAILPATSFACPVDVWSNTTDELFGDSMLSTAETSQIRMDSKLTVREQLQPRYERAMNHVRETLAMDDSQLTSVEGDVIWQATVARALQTLKVVVQSDLKRRTNTLNYGEDRSDFTLLVWDVRVIQDAYRQIRQKIEDLTAEHGRGGKWQVTLDDGTEAYLKALQRQATASQVTLQRLAEIYSEIDTYLEIVEDVVTRINTSTSNWEAIKAHMNWFQRSKIHWSVRTPAELHKIVVEWNKPSYVILGCVGGDHSPTYLKARGRDGVFVFQQEYDDAFEESTLTYPLLKVPIDLAAPTR